MKFELDAVLIEERCRSSTLATRVSRAVAPEVEVRYVPDGREAARPLAGERDPFAAGKRRMVVMERRAPFLMGCPAGLAEFACCGYLVLVTASNCPMDCSYCFLQEYVADNPGLQLYANYARAFDELERLGRSAPGRSFRVGTGELADSLAFDTLTGMSRDLVEYFARRENLLLELKTKTDEVGNLLTVDPRGRTLVSWTLSPTRVYESSEHRSAPPAVRIESARRVLEAGYKVGFHLDPLIAYPEAEHDYGELIENLFDVIQPQRISFVSMGGLRMTPTLRATARRRFPGDPMLAAGEEVLGRDGRMRSFTPLRMRLFASIRARIERQAPKVPLYLCMESASVYERVFGATPATPAALGARLAGR
jgi:spore photoproduct lyase